MVVTALKPVQHNKVTYAYGDRFEWTGSEEEARLLHDDEVIAIDGETSSGLESAITVKLDKSVKKMQAANEALKGEIATLHKENVELGAVVSTVKTKLGVADLSENAIEIKLDSMATELADEVAKNEILENGLIDVMEALELPEEENENATTQFQRAIERVTELGLFMQSVLDVLGVEEDQAVQKIQEIVAQVPADATPDAVNPDENPDGKGKAGGAKSK